MPRDPSTLALTVLAAQHERLPRGKGVNREIVGHQPQKGRTQQLVPLHLRLSLLLLQPLERCCIDACCIALCRPLLPVAAGTAAGCRHYRPAIGCPFHAGSTAVCTRRCLRRLPLLSLLLLRTLLP